MFNLFKKIKPQSAPTASTTRAEKPLVNPEELARAKQEAKEVIVRANEDATRIREEAAREASRIKQEALEAERKLQSRESQLANNERRSQQALEASEAAKADIETARETMLAKLEKVSGMTKEQAKETLLTGWEDKMQGDISRRIRQAEEEMKLSLEEKTKELQVDEMNHGATDYVAE